MTLQPKDLLVEEKPLARPPLEEVANALRNGLTKYFATVAVEVVDCPDLTTKPFSLAAKGLSGSTRVVEVGGVPYLMPVVNRTKIYDLKHFNDLVGVDPALIIGAGAGPFSYAGTNCELVANSIVTGGKVHSLTQIAKLKDESKGNDFVTETLPDSESRFAILANLFVCEGKPGKVVKVHCKKRIGTDDFVTAIRSSLIEKFKEQSVGVGGAFLVTGSKVKQHVMPDFSATPLVSNAMVDEWLRFYDMNPPLISVGTLVTVDPGLNLRLQHFHSFSDHNEAGHYHYDTTPDTVEYLGYFNLGEKIIRIDRPMEESKIGHN